MDNRPFVWQMVKEAVEGMGGSATYSQIKDYIRKRYGDKNEGTITYQTIKCTVNQPSRIHYPVNKKPRVANSRYDFLFTTGRGQVTLYDPSKHGTWEIRRDESGELIVVRTGVDPTADVHPTVILEGNVTIGAFTKIGAGAVITGNVTIGHHTLIQCNMVIRGNNTIGNWVHIYDLVCIEGGRPAKVGSSAAQEPDRSIIGEECWINHGATMHGSQLGDGAVLDLNASLDYNCRIGKGAIVTNGSACRVNTVVPDNCIAEGVPARLAKENITDDDRRQLMGLVPREWVHYAGERQEQQIRAKKNL